MASAPICAAVCALLLSGVVGACTSEIGGSSVAEVDEPDDPGESDPEDPEPPEPSDPEPEPEPEPEPGFDVNDPADYRWTLTVERFYTLEVLRGSAQVQWSRFAPGVDPETGQAAAAGTFAGPTVLAENLRFAELTGGAFQFHTIRAQDGQPMTSCVKLLDGAQAIASHNEILANGHPETDPLGFTNPETYAAHLAQLGGVLLLVDGDCTTPSQDNPSEQRSVLSFAAVTVIATPDPQVYDPSTDPDPSGGIFPAGA